MKNGDLTGEDLAYKHLLAQLLEARGEQLDPEEALRRALLQTLPSKPQVVNELQLDR